MLLEPPVYPITIILVHFLIVSWCICCASGSSGLRRLFDAQQLRILSWQLYAITSVEATVHDGNMIVQYEAKLIQPSM